MAWPVVTVASGGLPVTLSANGLGTPVEEAANGFGTPVTYVDKGGLAVLAGVLPPWVPAVGRSFDQLIASGGYNKIGDFSFGTNAPPAGATQIADATALGNYFQNYANNLGTPTQVINVEVQRYAPFSSAANYVFTPTGLELTAALPAGVPPDVLTKAVVGAVSNSRQVTLSDVTGISIGQILGLGAADLANLYKTTPFAFRGTLTVGEDKGLTIVPAVAGLFNPVTISKTVDGSTTLQSLAQYFVDQINANAGLQAAGITAFKDPINPSAYCLVSKRLQNPGGPAFGSNADGSINYIVLTPTYTGVLIHEKKSDNIFTFVTGIAGNVLTLNHPVTLANAAPVVVTTSRCFMASVHYTAASAVIPMGDTTGIEVGQLISLSFQDSNLRRVISKTATDLTISISAGIHDGVYCVSLAARSALTNAVTTAVNVLKFASVPVNVRIGDEVQLINTSPSVSTRITEIDRVSTPNTITVDKPMTVASGATMLIYPAIDSAQIWSKFHLSPNELNRDYIAIEVVATNPDIDRIGWGAGWLNGDPTSATGLPDPGGTLSEWDIWDDFNYNQNAGAGNVRPGGGGAVIYSDPAWTSSGLAGNNHGTKKRKFQFIFTQSTGSWFCDGLYFLQRQGAWRPSIRAQFALNLAMGSTQTSFNPNGFFPIDFTKIAGTKLVIERVTFYARPGSDPLS